MSFEIVKLYVCCDKSCDESFIDAIAAFEHK